MNGKVKEMISVRGDQLLNLKLQCVQAAVRVCSISHSLYTIRVKEGIRSTLE